MRNVILKRIFCLFVPPIYSLLCKGCRNEDCGHALLLLAMEVVSFILDLLGGSDWGYLLASFLLSTFILHTTIYAYFIRRSRIKSEAQQLIAVEIVFSVLQLIISCYCLVKTLSGVKTNYSSSVFPLAYAIISVVFTFKSKKDFSHSSSDTPPDTPSSQSGIVKDTDELEINSIRVDPSDTPVDDNVDPLDPTLVSVPISSANVPQANTLRQRNKQSQLKVTPTLGSVPSSLANEIQPEPSTSSRDKITSEVSDDHRCNNDKAKSRKILLATGVFSIVGTAIILFLSIKRRLFQPQLYIVFILMLIGVGYLVHGLLHRPTRTKKKGTRMERVRSRYESDSRDIPRNSSKNSLSSDIGAQIVYEDGVTEEKEEKFTFYERFLPTVRGFIKSKICRGISPQITRQGKQRGVLIGNELKKSETWEAGPQPAEREEEMKNQEEFSRRIKAFVEEHNDEMRLKGQESKR